MQAEWRAGRIGVRQVAWGTWLLARYSLGREVRMEEAFEQATATLAGSEEHLFADRTHAWFDAMVAARLRPGAVAALERHRSNSEPLVVATSGTVYAARAAQRAFGMDDAIGTSLEVVEGRFTGRIAGMGYGAAKRTLVEAWAAERGIDLAESSFYSDSITDLPLLEAVGTPVIVNPDRPLAREAVRRGWPVVDWGTT